MSERPAERGRDADWRDPWPVEGVRRGEPQASAGVDALRADGYVAVFDVDAVEADRDIYQDHLGNTAAVRMFNELRIAYVAALLAPRWPRYVRREQLAVVVRESHVLYESEGWMHERFVGATRVASRHGRAAILEQRLVEATSARPIARGWFVQLLVAVEGVVDWPGWYWDMVAEVEGAPVPAVPDSPRPPWGSPR